MKEQRKEDVFIMEYLTNIAKDQDNDRKYTIIAFGTYRLFSL